MHTEGLCESDGMIFQLSVCGIVCREKQQGQYEYLLAGSDLVDFTGNVSADLLSSKCVSFLNQICFIDFPNTFHWSDEQINPSHTTVVMSSVEEIHMCPMCRDLFGQAQPFPCGHILCPACVRDAWRQSASSDRGRRFVCSRCLEERGVVVCDCCPQEESDDDQKCAAVKTCLRCEVSLCEQHLIPHLQRPAYRTHLLVEPLTDMSRRRCPAHREVFRYYCIDDMEYVCADCILEGQHAQHLVKGMRKMEEEYKQDSSMSDVSQVLQMGSALQAQVDRLVSAVTNITEQERQLALERVQEDFSRVREDLKQTENIHRFLGSLLEESDPFLLIWMQQIYKERHFCNCYS
ncbi:E3 ubiquitin/ISG15 ligase TRIM25 isoform X2 [Triplophysa rosa]|uniref:E3 ubiquitin/ISG15 ligase TRIM25 isoform X2 n=1 Tax=Triplophysa rosa TaxID=992332 RepID=UPI00254635B2|nr:E3 ubiquitin/ISG15 ligase TRIM25 isoform X2 [Triplophysa rosa]